MKIKVHINQAEAFRRGIDAKTSTKMITVKPSALPEAVRQLLADNFIPGTTDIKNDVQIIEPSLVELVTQLVALRKHVLREQTLFDINEWLKQTAHEEKAEGGLLFE
jgi:hypothetical protein